MEGYKKKVICAAVCNVCWTKSPPSFMAMRHTLDTLVAGTYDEVSDEHISLLLLQLHEQELTETACLEMSGAELAGRKKARQKIAAEVLDLGRRLDAEDLYYIDQLVGAVRK